MIRKLTYTFGALLVLTLATAFISIGESIGHQLAGFLIMAIATAKVLLVVFQFMELRLAHRAWKVGFTALLALLVLSIVLLL